MTRLSRNVKVLGLASLLNDIASEMIFPLLPTFLIQVLHGNRLYLGAIEGTADSVASLLKLWSGGRSDQAGRRKGFVIFGYLLTVLTRPLAGLLIAPWQLLGVRVADRIGKGLRSSPRDALIADSTEAQYRGRAFGFQRAMDHLGAAIGPLLAAGFLWFWPDRLRALFVITIIPGLLLLAALFFGLQESPAAARRTEPLQLSLKPFAWNFRLYLLALVAFTLGNSSDAFLLVRAEELGVPTVLLPVLWAAFHVVKSSSNLVLGRAVDRYGPRRLILLGWFIYAGVYLGFGVATTATEAWICFLVYAVFFGLTEPAEKTLVANLVGNERKGLAYGWYNLAIGIATLPASLLFGVLYQYGGSLVAFGWGATLAFLAAGLLLAIKPSATDK